MDEGEYQDQQWKHQREGVKTAAGQYTRRVGQNNCCRKDECIRVLDARVSACGVVKMYKRVSGEQKRKQTPPLCRKQRTRGYQKKKKDANTERNGNSSGEAGGVSLLPLLTD